MEMRYIELKTGYNDNGPAWIGKVKLSKSGQTIYFNDKAFKKCHGVYANYYDIETGDEYWISNVKKDGTDRHWAGSGKITVDKNIISEYHTLNRNKTTSPSCMIYSLPSLRTRPFSFAAAMDPHSISAS